MRTSLALKIFLSFWLIHALIFVVLGLVPRSGPPPAGGRPPFPYDLLITAIIVSGVVCLVLARNLASPLRRMRAATHRLTGGDLSARAGAGFGRRRDEIGDVVRDFDAMAERIESLLHAQQQLLSDISHELRSPLARLNVALELARRTAGGAAEAHLARIESEAERMNELVGRLLALSRAETAGARAPIEEFDLAETIQRVADDARYEAHRTGKRVDVSVHGQATLRGDPLLIASAVENVIRNAIKYTPPDSTVDVTATVTADHAQIVVRDHGTGIPEADLSRVFLPFYRVDGSRDRESGGTGLGLSIAQRAVASQGGTIRADNAEGGGLQVTVTLPIASH
jgi:two-component system, OmpR family, sensor histidine kinase CpxA